jgi:LCP family protein required for cell wall assembly
MSAPSGRLQGLPEEVLGPERGRDRGKTMRYVTRYLVQGLVLVFLLVVIALVSRWLLLPELATANVSPTATIPPIESPATSAPPTTTPTPTFTPSPSPIPTATGTPPSTATATPTPQPPILFHATPVVGTPPMRDGTPLPIPTPAPLVQQPENAVNIVLLGTDAGGALTDVMVVASVNADGPSISLLSIPRDLYVWIPGYGYGKINTANGRGANYPGGGPALVGATIEYNLGIPIHYYALVRFEGFVRIVDALGGIDVPVECELHDTFPDPANPEQGIDIDLNAGMQHLDGQYALWYVRSRKGISTRDVYGTTTTSDFDRNRRQQQVLRALYHQVLDLNILSRVPELWEATQQSVQTNLGLDDLLWLGMVGSQLDLSNLKSRFIAPPYVTGMTDPDAGSVQVPVPGALEPLIVEALAPPAVGRADQPAFRVEVWDGTGRPGMAEVAVARLAWEGFAVVDFQTVGPIARTQIVDLTTTDKGSPLWLLTRLYARGVGDVVSQPIEGAAADFRILLGADYNSCVSTQAIHYVPAPTPTPTPPPTP